MVLVVLAIVAGVFYFYSSKEVEQNQENNNQSQEQQRVNQVVNSDYYDALAQKCHEIAKHNSIGSCLDDCLKSVEIMKKK